MPIVELCRAALSNDHQTIYCEMPMGHYVDPPVDGEGISGWHQATPPESSIVLWCNLSIDPQVCAAGSSDLTKLAPTPENFKIIKGQRDIYIARWQAVEAQLAEAQTAAQAWRERAEYDDGLISRIWDAVREYLPDAIGHNTLPEIVAGIARQRDGQHEIKDHLADAARKLTTERDAASVTLDKIREFARNVETNQEVLALRGIAALLDKRQPKNDGWTPASGSAYPEASK